MQPRLKTFFALAPATVEGLPRPYWALWGATLVNRLGTFVLPMLMVYLTRARHLPLEEAGAVLSLFGAGGLVSHLSGGVLADRVGRRFTMLLSLTTGAFFMLLLGAAHSPAQLAAAALGLGLTLHLFHPASQAYVADVVAPEHRLKAYSHLYWAVNLGFAVGTSIAGLVAEVSFVGLFVGDALTTLACAALLYRYAPESRPAPDRASQPKGGHLLTPFLDPVFAPFVALNFLTALVFFQHLVAMPLAMERQGLGTRDYGLAIALNGLLIVLLQPTVTHRIPRYRRGVVLAVACALTGLGFGGMALAHSLPAVMLTVLVWTVGEILMSPVNGSVVADLAPEHLRGRYQGAMSLTWSSAVLVAPLVSPRIIVGAGFDTLWAACLGVGLLTAAGHLALAPRRARRLALAPLAGSGLRD